MFWDNPRIKRSFRQSLAEWLQVRFSNSHMYCCSNVTRAALNNLYAIGDEISVIPNCYDDRKFNLKYNQTAVKPLKIISVGHMREEKQHSEKILICSLLKKMNCNFTLEIIGEGDFPELKSMIIEYDLQNEIFFSESSVDISEHLRNSHIFLFTSISEGFPVSLLEAMATGLTCITYQFPGLDEIDQNFDNLEVVRQGDFNTAVEKIIYYSKNNEQRIELGKRAAEHVEKLFSAKINTAQWEKYLLDT
jgi:glycosyltransferase involved in cell wall biosynthesis